MVQNGVVWHAQMEFRVPRERQDCMRVTWLILAIDVGAFWGRSSVRCRSRDLGTGRASET